MSLDEICALPVEAAAAPDCALFLWITDPMLPAAFKVIDAWGFTFKTVAFTWAKTNAKSAGFSVGLGYWTRANPEQCLLATRGSPRRRAKDVRQLIVAPRQEHSRKPDEIRSRIERLVAGPYLEMFARQRAAGWDAFGDQATLFNQMKGEETPAAGQLHLIDYIDAMPKKKIPAETSDGRGGRVPSA
jgi:N6-adenosine-specific RNA methylase IME4